MWLQYRQTPPLVLSRGHLSWKTWHYCLCSSRNFSASDFSFMKCWCHHLIGMFWEEIAQESLPSNIDLGSCVRLTSLPLLPSRYGLGCPGDGHSTSLADCLAGMPPRGSFPTPTFRDCTDLRKFDLGVFRIIQLTYHFCLFQPFNIINTFASTLMKGRKHHREFKNFIGFCFFNT